jgi:hypothetical protein
MVTRSTGKRFMPKIIEYPKASLQRAVSLAETVDSLGGECTDQSAAEAMGNKVGGAFRTLISATVKYGLLSYTRSRLKIEPLFQDYKLAYSETEKQGALRKAFLSAPLFASIAKRFDGQILPPHFENLLIREHRVSEDLASRVAGYFAEGARDAGIITSNGTVHADPKHITIAPGTGGAALQASASSVSSAKANLTTGPEPEEASAGFVRGYTVRVTGPGIDSTIAIKDEDDVAIVESMLKKVRKLLNAQDELLK